MEWVSLKNSHKTLNYEISPLAEVIILLEAQALEIGKWQTGEV